MRSQPILGLFLIAILSLCGTAVWLSLSPAGPAQATPAPKKVGVVDLESGAVDTLATATRITYAYGHVIFSGADGTVLAQPFDPGARETTGPAVAILDGVGGSGPNLMGAFAVSISRVRSSATRCCSRRECASAVMS